MKNIRLLLFSTLAGLSLLASCGKDSLHNTSHPNHGVLSILTEWGTGTPATIPYIVNYGLEGSDEFTTEEGRSRIHTINKLLDPGTYRLELYSKDAEGTGFSVDGDVIEVIEDPADPGFIYANPSVFFSARTSVRVDKDKDIVATVPLYPQMRKLVIRVFLRNDPVIYTASSPGGSFRELHNIQATLDGVANRFDFIADSYDGSQKVKLPFRVRRTDDNKQRYLETTVTLVGFNESETQKFDLSFEFEFGENVPAVSETLHDLLFDRGEKGDFNDYDKKRVNDTILREIVLPITPGGSAIITDYEPHEEGDIEVGEDTYQYAVGDLWPKDSPQKQGVVIWVAETVPGSGRGAHGLVMSGRQSPPLGWGQRADIPQLNDAGNQEASNGILKWWATFKLGNVNTSQIRNYINRNKAVGYDSRHTEADFPAYSWIRGAATQFTPDWFFPSTDEIQLLDNIPDLNDILVGAGMDPLRDESGENPPYLWTSQTEIVMKDKGDWHDPEVPEFDSAWIFTWHPVNGIVKTHAGFPNPAYNPDWVPDEDSEDPESPTMNPERPLILVEYYTRAFRYF